MDDLQEANYRLIRAEAEMQYLLNVFGDELAKRKGYKALRGMDAIHFHLCITHHWTPSVVRSMKPEDIRFLLEEEMHNWTAPAGSLPERDN